LIPFPLKVRLLTEREREREREIIINDRLKCSAQNHNPFANNHGQDYLLGLHLLCSPKGKHIVAALSVRSGTLSGK